METKLKVIAETADISLDEAKLAYELADGDLERALTMIPFVEKSIIIVHGKFVCGRNNKLYGIFRLVANGKEGQLLDFGLAMSYTLNDVDSPISANPEAFKKVVDSLFKQTDNNQVQTFLAGFYHQFGAAQINQIYHLIKEEREVELRNCFSDLVGKIWGNSERVEVELETFQLTRVQCEKKGLLSNITPMDEDDIEEDVNLTIYLETEPIISAVKGKTIDKFALGDLIPLKIVDDREAGKYLGQILSNDIGIAVATIKDFYFKELSERYMVTVEFGPKINGRFMIEPSVRLASYSDVPEVDAAASTAEYQNFSTINSLLFVLLGVMLGVLIFFLLSG